MSEELETILQDLQSTAENMAEVDRLLREALELVEPGE